MTTLSKLSAYGPKFQVKVLGILLTNKEFLINVSDSLDGGYFENTAHQWVIDKILKYFQKYHTIPTVETLAIEVKKLDNEILKIAVTESLREAYSLSEAKDVEYVEEEFVNFCRNQQVKKAIFNSVELLNVGDFDGIRNIMNNALKTGQKANLGLDYQKDIEQRYREDDRRPIPYPWNVFNSITDGGYGRGELILIFGNPKGGKSWATIDMAAHAASLGYNIVYFTLELSQSYVGRRMDAYLTKIPMDKLKDNRGTIERKVSEIKGRIRIKEFAAGRASLDDVEIYLQQLEIQEDFIPEAIYVDYLDLLRNRNKARTERREDIDDVYTDARGLARERGLPIVSPSQVNRAGSKDDIIESDKIAGSYGKIMIGDFAVSLSRKRKDKLNGTGRWHIMGNRNGPDGLTFGSKIDTTNGDIIIYDTPLEDDGEEEAPKKGNYNNIDDDDKDVLRDRFFKMNEEKKDGEEDNIVNET